LLLKNFLRQNRKSFFTNSVKVGLESTSDIGSGSLPILEASPPVSNFKSIKTGFSRFCLRSTDICKAGVATLAPNILHITIRIHEGFNALFTRKVAIR
ncbi:MAG: hypothetical protein V3S35_03605, partial [Nitrosomonadaceae bacterium]